MKLTLTNKAAVRFLDLVEWLCYLGLIIYVAITITDANDVTKKIDAETQQNLIEAYKVATTGQHTPITFEQYRPLKMDSVHSDVLAAMVKRGENVNAPDDFKGWNLFLKVCWWLFAAFGIAVLCRALKNSFTAQDKLERMEAQLFLISREVSYLRMKQGPNDDSDLDDEF